MARLATTNTGLGIDVVPITFALLPGDRLVSIVDQKPKSTTRLRRLDNIRAHPEVTVLVDHYEDDWDAAVVGADAGHGDRSMAEGEAFDEARGAARRPLPAVRRRAAAGPGGVGRRGGLDGLAGLRRLT